MKRIQLLPLGAVPQEHLAELAEGLAQEFLIPCEIQSAISEPSFAFNVTRQQYSSTEILAALARRDTPDTFRVLGVTTLDLYIPILTFVFGEAQLGGTAAVVSLHRLRDEFYGLPPNIPALRERLLKEAVHELGHTLTLSHCEDYQCVMSASHGVELVDLKSSRFCPACRDAVPSRTELKALNGSPFDAASRKVF
ncbi:MAG TPA: archaemetzincin family Zn-dependent metalloprotease [Terriglobales bacterium]|nr:archaemetzincin family Zn-dependent metalloprotease [Terriglobales bacterium]